MEGFIVFLTILVVLASLIIVGLVLMQPSKDAGLGGLSNTGTTGGSSVLGGGRNAFVNKLTWGFGIFIIVGSLVIGALQAKVQVAKNNIDNSSILNTLPEEEPKEIDKKQDNLPKEDKTK